MSRFHCGIALGLLAVAAGCSGDRPTTPSLLVRVPVSSVEPPPPPPPPPPFDVPPLTGPSTLYRFSGPLLPASQVQGYTTTSSYVLYDNGAFALRYAAPAFEYPGAYVREGDRISFRWGPAIHATATGTLNGEWLEVRYSDVLQHSDYENAVYRRAQ